MGYLIKHYLFNLRMHTNHMHALQTHVVKCQNKVIYTHLYTYNSHKILLTIMYVHMLTLKL